MSTILINGMNSQSLLTAGYGAIGIIISTAIRQFRIHDRLYKISDHAPIKIHDKILKV